MSSLRLLSVMVLGLVSASSFAEVVFVSPSTSLGVVGQVDVYSDFEKECQDAVTAMVAELTAQGSVARGNLCKRPTDGVAVGIRHKIPNRPDIQSNQKAFKSEIVIIRSGGSGR